MSEQLLVRLTIQNSSREMYVSSYRWVHFSRADLSIVVVVSFCSRFIEKQKKKKTKKKSYLLLSVGQFQFQFLYQFQFPFHLKQQEFSCCYISRVWQVVFNILFVYLTIPSLHNCLFPFERETLFVCFCLFVWKGNWNHMLPVIVPVPVPVPVPVIVPVPVPVPPVTSVFV